jgi:RNA polymerase sigma-70 factor (ECF subfamily)
MEDDAELVKRILSGNRGAAGEIYDRYSPLVRADLFDATGSLAEADELVQIVFVRGLTHLGQLRRPERIGGWLIGIARREGKEFRRQAGRRRQRFTPLVDHPAPMTQAFVNDTVSLISEAVRELPERERMAVHIHYLCGEPAQVARQALGLSQSGFYKLLERARCRLRARLLELEKHR